MDEDETRFRVNDPEVQEQMRARRLQRVIAKMYMGYLAIDKDFLEEIVGQPEIATLELVELTSQCHRHVDYLQDLLRARRPLYVTLFERRAIPRGHKAARKRKRKLQANSIIVAADSLLRRLHAARVNKDYPAFFRLVVRCLDYAGIFASRVRYSECSFIGISSVSNYRDILAPPIGDYLNIRGDRIVAIGIGNSATGYSNLQVSNCNRVES